MKPSTPSRLWPGKSKRPPIIPSLSLIGNENSIKSSSGGKLPLKSKQADRFLTSELVDGVEQLVSLLVILECSDWLGY